MDDVVSQWNRQAVQLRDQLTDLAQAINAKTFHLLELKLRLDRVTTLYTDLDNLYYRLEDT